MDGNIFAGISIAAIRQSVRHFRVEKTSRADDTTTDVIALSKPERLEEIARMLGGRTITEQARAHADEMIAGQT